MMNEHLTCEHCLTSGPHVRLWRVSTGEGTEWVALCRDREACDERAAALWQAVTEHTA